MYSSKSDWMLPLLGRIWGREKTIAFVTLVVLLVDLENINNF